MTITTSNYTLRGQESGANLFVAIDNVTDVIDRQIQRYKGKIYRSGQARKTARAASAIVESSFVEEEDIPEEATVLDFGKVVRTKRFPMKPMSVEDAVLEMELLGHSFFLFFNLDSKGYNVVYRRSDGDYGVIEPVMS